MILHWDNETCSNYKITGQETIAALRVAVRLGAL